MFEKKFYPTSLSFSPGKSFLSPSSRSHCIKGKKNAISFLATLPATPSSYLNGGTALRVLESQFGRAQSARGVVDVDLATAAGRKRKTKTTIKEKTFLPAAKPTSCTVLRLHWVVERLIIFGYPPIQ